MHNESVHHEEIDALTTLLVEQGAWMVSQAHDVALPGRDHHLEGCIHGEAPLRQLRPKGSAIAWERVERALSPSG